MAMLPPPTIQGGGTSSGNWIQDHKGAAIAIGALGLAVVVYFYLKNKSSSSSTAAYPGSSVTIATSPSGGSGVAASNYNQLTSPEEAYMQQLASLQSAIDQQATSAYQPTVGQVSGTLPSGEWGGPGGTFQTAPVSTQPSYSQVIDPFWGQQGVTVPDANLTPGTQVYYKTGSGQYQLGGTYDPTAQNEYNITGWPNAQQLQSVGSNGGIYLQNAN